MGQGNGVLWCPYQTGEQAAEMYATRLLAQDLGCAGLRIVNRRPRPDLNQESTQAAAAYGLKVRDSWARCSLKGPGLAWPSAAASSASRSSWPPSMPI